MATTLSTQEAELKIRTEQITKHFSGNFNAVLNNPTAKLYFYEFLKSEFNAATVNFLNQMEYLYLIYGDQVEGRDELEVFDLPLIQQLRMIYLNSIFSQPEQTEAFSGKPPENMSSELHVAADEYYEKVLGKKDTDEKSTDEAAVLAANESRITEYNNSAKAFYQKFDRKDKVLLNGKSLFDAVHNAVLSMLFGDTFIRFQSSRFFKELTEGFAKQNITIKQLTVIPPRMYDQIKALRKNMKNYIDTVEQYKKEHPVKPKAQSLLGTVPGSSSVLNFFKFLPSIDDRTVSQKMDGFRTTLLAMQTKLQTELELFSQMPVLTSSIRSLLASIKTVLIKSKMFTSNSSDASEHSSSPFVAMFDSLKLRQTNNKDKDLLGKSRSQSVTVADNAAALPPMPNMHKTGARTLKVDSKRITRTHSLITDEMAEICKNANAAASGAASSKETSPSTMDSSTTTKKPDSSPRGP